MLGQILNTIERFGMLEKGDHVVAALSGGADSVCLLLALNELRDELGIKVSALHVNHCLRGEESDRDGLIAAALDAGYRLCELARVFLDGVASRVPGVRLLCPDSPRLPGLMALLLPGMSAERAIAELDLLGVCVSGGAACASRAGEVSHVYRALGLSDADAACVIRVSLGRHTTRAEVVEAVEAVVRVYEGSTGTREKGKGKREKEWPGND